MTGKPGQPTSDQSEEERGRKDSALTRSDIEVRPVKLPAVGHTDGYVQPFQSPAWRRRHPTRRAGTCPHCPWSEIVSLRHCGSGKARTLGTRRWPPSARCDPKRTIVYDSRNSGLYRGECCWMPVPNDAQSFQRSTVRNGMYPLLQGWPVTAGFRLGEKPRDRDRSESLGVSRTPTREVFQWLMDEGPIEISQTSYTRVSPVTVATAVQLYAVIGVLKSQAASLNLPRRNDGD
jgi:hypothetical protein